MAFIPHHHTPPPIQAPVIAGADGWLTCGGQFTNLSYAKGDGCNVNLTPNQWTSTLRLFTYREYLKRHHPKAVYLGVVQTEHGATVYYRNP